MVALIAGLPEKIEKMPLPKNEALIEEQSLSIEQELLAEIQVYRDKQKQLEDLQTARNYKNRAIRLIAYLSYAWFLIVCNVGLILPSILPSFHPQLSAITVGFLLAGLILGLYDTATLWSEKKSITQLEHYESRAAEDKKALGLLDKLKQNQEMYQQKVEEELRESFRSLSRLLFFIPYSMAYGQLTYKLFGESRVAVLLFCVFSYSTFVAYAHCSNMAHSGQKSEEKQPPV